MKSLKKEDAKTGVTTISTVKKLAAYHQYYAVNRAVESAMRATGHSPSIKGWQTQSDGVVSSPPSEGWSKTGVILTLESKNSIEIQRTTSHFHITQN